MLYHYFFLALFIPETGLIENVFKFQCGPNVTIITLFCYIRMHP